MSIYADLHSHTSISDGVLSPSELVDRAIAQGLSVLAITDHDTVAGIEEAVQFAGDRLKIIPSIELSSEYRGRDIHILGHYIDHKNPKLQKQLEQYKVIRQERADKMVIKLKEHFGIEINLDDVKSSRGNGVIGRLHISKAIIAKGYAQTIQETFEKMIGEDAPAYVEKFKLTPKDAFALIKEFGGTSYWAHPVKTGLLEHLDELVKDGLEGLEVYHPSHSKEDEDRLYNLTRRYNLKISGGSDFHSPENPVNIGEVGLTRKDYIKYF